MTTRTVYPDTRTFLSDQQQARVEALRKVNSYVRSTSPISGSAADPFALMRLANFVLTGDDLPLETDGDAS